MMHKLLKPASLDCRTAFSLNSSKGGEAAGQRPAGHAGTAGLAAKNKAGRLPSSNFIKKKCCVHLYFYFCTSP
jgi:hypothetical protein